MSEGLRGLHPELSTAVFQHPRFGTYINHPLVKLTGLHVPFPHEIYSEHGFSGWVDLANAALEKKREGLRAAIKNRDWYLYVFLHERAYRFEALMKLMAEGYAVIDELWPVVGEVWSDSENIWQYCEDWLDLWQRRSRRKQMTMDKKERAAFRALPGELVIYRGVNCEEEWEADEFIHGGLSWTLDREKAVWFARRFATKARRPYVGSATISKRHSFALFTGREENEIIVNPIRLTNVEIKKIRRA